MGGRDAPQYSHALQLVHHLGARKRLWQERQQLEARLRAGAPGLAAELERTSADPQWDERLGAFEAAWRWLRADARLTFLANPDVEVEVREQLADCREQLRAHPR